MPYGNFYYNSYGYGRAYGYGCGYGSYHDGWRGGCCSPCWYPRASCYPYRYW